MHKFAVFLALLFVGCNVAPRHPNLSAYEKDLKLSIRLASSAARAGGQLQLDFELENTGNRQLITCRYRESFVSFWGLQAKYARTRLGPLVDHQYCEVRMSVAPHQVVRWREMVDVPNVEAGPSKVMAAVRLVDPSDCDEYGCYDALASATAAEPLMVVPGG